MAEGMNSGVCVWQGDMHGRGMYAMHAPPPGHHEIWSVNMQVVHILLECILVFQKSYSIPV